MGKISPISIKYVIHAELELSGVVEKPDIIGAIFGQTEGLLGEELELRELQKSGKIGRIDVVLESKAGHTVGEILLPSSMGKAETAIIAAALETIERVGPCDAKIRVTKIEDVRVAKRNAVLERAKQLLQTMVSESPDIRAFTTLLTQNLRETELIEYGQERLPAGPDIDTSDEIIIVEGRADVVNLLRYGIRNVIGMKGAKPTDTIIDLTKKKVTTLFVDGDRGGDLIIKNLASLTDLDFVARAPDGKEVEELTQKEILKALRLKVSWEQAKNEIKNNFGKIGDAHKVDAYEVEEAHIHQVPSKLEPKTEIKQGLKPTAIATLKQLAEEIVGSRGAYILDNNFSILGKVPTKELETTLTNLDDVYAVVLDGEVGPSLAKLADSKGIAYLVAKSAIAKPYKAKLLFFGKF
ncbi:MAG: DNA primase DnaG [Candidatus Nanoarchaeia archaeon]